MAQTRANFYPRSACHDVLLPLIRFFTALFESASEATSAKRGRAASRRIVPNQEKLALMWISHR